MGNEIRGFIKTNFLCDSFTPLELLAIVIVLKHNIDLLQRKTFELRQDEPGSEKADNTKAHEDSKGLVADVGKYDQHNLGDRKIHDPIDSRKMLIPFVRTSRANTSVTATQPTGP